MTRRFHAFGVGLPRTGTLSLSQSLDCYAAHEPEAQTTIMHAAHDPTPTESVLRERDRRLGLELEVSHIVGEFTGRLVKAFPDAHFILTTRDPVTWALSYMRQWRGKDPSPVWGVYRRRVFGSPDRSMATQEGVIPHLLWWTRRHREVLDAVPLERLHIVRLANFEGDLRRVANDLGVDANPVHVNAQYYSWPEHVSIRPELVSKICGGAQQYLEYHLKQKGMSE